MSRITITGANTVVAEALQQLHDERGRLRATDVVEAATPETAPLHSYFEWDDSKAAQAHRLGQAANLIRSVKITVVRHDKNGSSTHKVRAYAPARTVGDGSEEPGTYYSVPELDETQRHLQLQQMNRELNGLRRRYSHLQEFWAALADIQHEQAEAS